jgi:hypothetical protein
LFGRTAQERRQAKLAREALEAWANHLENVVRSDGSPQGAPIAQRLHIAELRRAAEHFEEQARAPLSTSVPEQRRVEVDLTLYRPGGRIGA